MSQQLSRNDTVGCALPPHPGPLPQGEGGHFTVEGKGHPPVNSWNRSKRAPSPWGEGRGEGDRDIRTAWIRLSRQRVVDQWHINEKRRGGASRKYRYPERGWPSRSS